MSNLIPPVNEKADLTSKPLIVFGKELAELLRPIVIESLHELNEVFRGRTAATPQPTLSERCRSRVRFAAKIRPATFLRDPLEKGTRSNNEEPREFPHYVVIFAPSLFVNELPKSDKRFLVILYLETRPRSLVQGQVLVRYLVATSKRLRTCSSSAVDVLTAPSRASSPCMAETAATTAPGSGALP